jgi:hypothetical protein
MAGGTAQVRLIPLKTTSERAFKNHKRQNPNAKEYSKTQGSFPADSSFGVSLAFGVWNLAFIETTNGSLD